MHHPQMWRSRSRNSGVIVHGNDIVPLDSIKASLSNVGFRSGSYIQGDTLGYNQTYGPIE